MRHGTVWDQTPRIFTSWTKVRTLLRSAWEPHVVSGLEPESARIAVCASYNYPSKTEPVWKLDKRCKNSKVKADG